jgi:hypothetical protein
MRRKQFRRLREVEPAPTIGVEHAHGFAGFHIALLRYERLFVPALNKLVSPSVPVEKRCAVITFKNCPRVWQAQYKARLAARESVLGMAGNQTALAESGIGLFWAPCPGGATAAIGGTVPVAAWGWCWRSCWCLRSWGKSDRARAEIPAASRGNRPRGHSQPCFTPIEERSMSRLLIVLVVILVGVLGLGLYLRWFGVAPESADGKAHVTFIVDPDRIQHDE